MPLGAAFLYALGSVFLKRSLQDGACRHQTFHLTNFAIGLAFAPLLLLERGDPRWDLWHQPLIVTAFFFSGMWLSFEAIRRGDVSLVTPLMGTKVVFVALVVAFFTRGSDGIGLWIAAFLTATGVFLMGFREFRRSAAGHLAAIAAALLGALVFACCDVLVQSWSESFGAMTFLALSSIGVGACSVLMWLFQGRPKLTPNQPGAGYLIWGASLVGIQAVALGLSLSFMNDATGINVAYATRGLWALALIGVIGHWFGNHERHSAGVTFRWRVAGACLITTALVLAIVTRAQEPDDSIPRSALSLSRPSSFTNSTSTSSSIGNATPEKLESTRNRARNQD